jgi:hypothetical protein
MFSSSTSLRVGLQKLFLLISSSHCFHCYHEQNINTKRAFNPIIANMRGGYIVEQNSIKVRCQSVCPSMRLYIGFILRIFNLLRPFNINQRNGGAAEPLPASVRHDFFCCSTVSRSGLPVNGSLYLAHMPYTLQHNPAV